MIRSHIPQGVVAAALILTTPLVADEIDWFSDFQAVNRTSNGAPMDAAFQFELGVFEGSFVPTLANQTQWAANWRAAQRVDYNPLTQAFDGNLDVTDNDPPFTAGKVAYIWGWRLNGADTEWILLRADSWNWPAPDPFNPFPPFPLQWSAAEATAVIGEVNASGVPFLMKSAAVTGAASPTTTWPQWRTKFLGVTSNGPNDDPDMDGTPNLLEFVFATNPLAPEPPALTPLEVVADGGDRFLQIAIPRRAEHAAVLTVQVSSDLTTWNSGPLHTVTVVDEVEHLVVRDLTPLTPTQPRRFMRLQATLP